MKKQDKNNKMNKPKQHTLEAKQKQITSETFEELT